MKLITQRQLIQGVARKGRERYEPFRDDDLSRCPKKPIAEQLDEIDGDTATPEQVDEIIGNSSWTNLKCDECGEHGKEAVLRVGAEPDYENPTAYLCQKCVRIAATTIWKV